MYCKIFKFITGELVIGVTEEEEIDFNALTTVIFDPIKVELVRVQAQNSFFDTIVIKPLLPMTDQDFVIIRTQSIVYDGMLGESYIQQYRDFVETKAESLKNRQTSAEPDNLIFNSNKTEDDTENSEVPPENHLDLTDIDEEDPFDDYFPPVPSKPTFH
jgi:hypothetical protein